MIRRCLKTGIGGKSADHRTIYKACDVGINGRKKAPRKTTTTKKKIEFHVAVRWKDSIVVLSELESKRRSIWQVFALSWQGGLRKI